MRKLTMLVAFAAGYVLGARAGQERYHQIMGTVDKVRHDPRVQEKTQQAVDVAKQQAPLVADKVTAAAAKVGGTHGSDNGQPAHMSWALQDLP